MDIGAPGDDSSIKTNPYLPDQLYSLSCRKGVSRLAEDILILTELVRSLQRTEGNPDCFRSRDAENCDQQDCAWRAYCLAPTDGLARPERNCP